MDAVILVVPRRRPIDPLTLTPEWIVTYTCDHICLSRLGETAYLVRDDSIRLDFTTEEWVHIASIVPEPTIYALEYADINTCRALLLRLVERDDVVVDSDHGTILTGTAFVDRMRRDTEWDWRRSM